MVFAIPLLQHVFKNSRKSSRPATCGVLPNLLSSPETQMSIKDFVEIFRVMCLGKEKVISVARLWGKR